jgi:hypothetical protein
MNKITLYHGTSEEALESILEQGLQDGSCVSDDYELAEYYAENFSQPVVVELEADSSSLVIDTPALEEPIRQGATGDRYCDKESFEQAVWEAADQLCKDKGIDIWSKLSGIDGLALVNSARITAISKCFLSD